MTGKNEWYIEDKILVTYYEGEVSLDGLRQTTEETLAMLDESAAEQVHLLIDARHVEKQPYNVRAVYQTIQPDGRHQPEISQYHGRSTADV